MKDRLHNRLAALKAEYEAGQKVLANLESQKANLRETLLRISGAIQVLEEELAIANPAPNPASSPVPIAPETVDPMVELEPPSAILNGAHSGL